jgi:aminoglycoside phosphotransferase (APT) family kinase protein
VKERLSEAEHIEDVVRLRGGWTSQMRRRDLRGPAGRRSLVLRSFVKPFLVRHAEGLLTREAAILRLLGDTDVPAATLMAVDATAQYCDHPSLLMSLLPGTVLLDDPGADDRAELLARQLVRIHRLPVTARQRPRPYQAWASPERVTPPAVTERPEPWQRAVDLIRREPPAYQGRFLHRDLDVAHCSTPLALLHGVSAGMRFADRYVAAGGTLAADGPSQAAVRGLDRGPRSLTYGR